MSITITSNRLGFFVCALLLTLRPKQARADSFNVRRAGDVIQNVLRLSLHEADGVAGQRL